MNLCRDHERAWNERLDARALPPNAVEGHAATCPACRAVSGRYQALNQAILALRPPPAPPQGFADRVLAAASEEVRPVAGRVVPRTLGIAVAVAAVVVGVVSVGVAYRRPDAVAPTVRIRAIDPKGLSDALADAGSASWDLAREASAPAARVGRQVIEAAELPGASPVVWRPKEVRPASDVWRDVEDRVNAGVRPLEGSARHAFGFLLGAPPDEDAPPARPAEGA